MTAAEEKMFQEALSSIREGKNRRAKDLLTRLLRQNQQNAEYWLWMSAVVESPKEQRYCLNQVLQIDPQNEMARRGLILLGDLPPDERFIIPLEQQKRNWQVPSIAGIEESKVQLPFIKIAAAVFGLIVVIGLVIGALTSDRLWTFRNRNIVALGTAAPTPTYPATATWTVTVTPDYIGPTPPWGGLEATYTPTPIYVSTSHPLIEAYRIAQRNLDRGDYVQAVAYFEQAIEAEPESPDLYYFLAESHRRSGNEEQALDAYGQALEVDDHFAPAYYGRALTYLQGDSDQIALARTDLENAIDYDESYGEAYLVLANLDIEVGEFETAGQNLALASQYLPDSPLITLAYARLALAEDNIAAAIQLSEQSLEQDVTLLPAYRLIGRALQLDGQVKASLDPLYTYITYSEQEDAQAMSWLGTAYAANGLNEEALEIFEAAISADRWQVDVYLQRGEIYFNNQDYSSALDDFEFAYQISPESYDACMLTGRTLLLLQRPGNAYNQVSECQKLTEQDSQLAEMYFYRALALEALENDVAIRDWERMLDLPASAIQPGWRATAQAYLDTHYTATPTKTSTIQPTRTRTPTPTVTLQFTDIP